MLRNSLRVPLLASLSIGTTLLSAAAQNAAAKPAPGAAPAANGGAARAPADNLDLTGLPTFLKVVPGGSVEIGLSTAQFTAAACQVTMPERPEIAVKSAPEKVIEAMRRSASILGKRSVEVPAFLLGQNPVTNVQFEKFVAARRAAGAKQRPPFLWWQVGRADDFESKLEDIAKSFPKMDNAAVRYWERHGGELPYKLVDKKGKPIDDLPVVFVTWREANDFAGWVGMRLPTEVEWTRAARGDGKQVWPALEGGFADKLLELLGMASTAQKVLKPVGATKAAVGPFGHQDMFGQVWQFVGDLGYRPIAGTEPFATEWKLLQKDATGKLLDKPPTWKEEKVLAKGGSFLSSSEPIQLLIDARAPVQTVDVLESLGFRLAKSLKPGYDALYSALRGSFSRSAFATDQDVDLSTQVGAERYEMDATGFPTSYETVTFAPVNWLSKDKNPELAKMIDKSEHTPMLVGVLMTTGKMLEPAAEGGIYSVLYRHAGMPKDLAEAIKQGAKEIAAAAKNKGEEKQDDKKSTWREVIAKFGITDKDLESKEAQEGNLKFVRVEGFEVPTDDDYFLLLGNEGKVVAAWKCTNAKPAAANVFPNTLSLEAEKGKMVAKFHVGVPIALGNGKRVADFHIQVTLDRDAPAADKPWRQAAAK